LLELLVPLTLFELELALLELEPELLELELLEIEMLELPELEVLELLELEVLELLAALTIHVGQVLLISCWTSLVIHSTIGSRPVEMLTPYVVLLRVFLRGWIPSIDISSLVMFSVPFEEELLHWS